MMNSIEGEQGMQSRREFMMTGLGTGAGLLLADTLSARAATGNRQVKGATAITQVFGDGVRLTAVAVEYDAPVKGTGLSPASFSVEGRTVTGAFTSTSANLAGKANEGRFVILTLSADDANTGLAEQVKAEGGSNQPAGAAGGPVGNAGDIPADYTIYKPAQATILRLGAVQEIGGNVIATHETRLATTKVENLIVDDFRQLVFHDPKTGRILRYNLFVPKAYDSRKSYPLVLFMHDAGATSDVTRTTLFQGLGAVVWARPEDQARRPSFVLAPEYPEIIADDLSHTSSMLDVTIDLIKQLGTQYRIDRSRLYATGQSGGCMMSIAMNIKYPDFFASSFLVAGQWSPALVKPLAKKKLWILVSQDDDKAYPGENAITEVLEKNGAKISRVVWDGTWNAGEFRAAFEKIDPEDSPINYVAFKKGTVIPAGQSTAGGSGHRNTWRIAYTIEPIREWIFRERG
jgi:predicted peptidase